MPEHSGKKLISYRVLIEVMINNLSFVYDITFAVAVMEMKCKLSGYKIICVADLFQN